MKVTKSVTIPDVQFIAVDKLMKYLSTVPNSAKLYFTRFEGDYGQMDGYRCEISWDEEL